MEKPVRRRKNNPVGFRQADFNKCEKITYNKYFSKKKKRAWRELVVPQRNSAKGRSADAEERPEIEKTLTSLH